MKTNYSFRRKNGLSDVPIQNHHPVTGSKEYKSAIIDLNYDRVARQNTLKHMLNNGWEMISKDKNIILLIKKI